MKNQRQSVGKWGETLAEQYLQQDRGFEILGRNIRTQYGEIDILARDGDLILFVEVKTRTTSNFAYPEDSVHAIKRDHMDHAAQAFIQDHPEYGDQWRIDVIAIRGRNGSPVEITYFENALNR